MIGRFVLAKLVKLSDVFVNKFPTLSNFWDVLRNICIELNNPSINPFDEMVCIKVFKYIVCEMVYKYCGENAQQLTIQTFFIIAVHVLLSRFYPNFIQILP